jgi:hypothetical protein
VIVVPGLVNRGPRADAGGILSVGHGTGFVLTGAASADPEGESLTHEWGQISGPDAALSGEGPDRLGNSPVGDALMRFLLMVHDGLKYGPPDLAAVISGETPVPVADADQDVLGDPDTDIVLDAPEPTLPPGRTAASWEWTQLSGLDFYDVVAEDALFDPAQRTTTIHVPLDTLSSLTPDRALVFALEVTDDQGATSFEDLTTVTFANLPDNAIPLVVAVAPAFARPDELVTLDGSQSWDSDDDPLTYRWTQIGGGTPVVIVNDDQAIATFDAPDVTENLSFKLEVDDGQGNPGSVQSATVLVKLNEAPDIQVSVDPTSGPAGTLVTLDASGTTDADDAQLEFRWEEVDLPAGENPLVLSDDETAVATFTMPAYNVSGYLTPAERTRTLRLSVTDAVETITRDVSFVPNQPPTILAVTATPNRIRYDNTTTSSLKASPISDDDNDVLTYTWRILAGSPQINTTYFSATTGQTVTFKVPAPSPTLLNTGGVYTLGATGSDGVASTGEVTVKLLAYPSYLNDVYNGIISPNCGVATTGCHDGTNPKFPLQLDFSTAANAHSNLIGFGRVAPNAATSSVLFRVVSTGPGGTTPNGAKGMPLTGTKLPQHLINIIRDWIEPDGTGGSSGFSTGAENN